MGTGWNVLDAAHDALRDVVAGVGGGWQVPTPCTAWNVTQVLQHAAYDQAAYAAKLTGGDGPAENPFTPSGRIDGEPAAFLAATLDESATAWSSVAPDAAAVPTPLPQGDMSGALAAGAAALDAAVHAWDIAAATRQPSPLTDELAADLLPVAKELVEPLRGWGAYAAAVDGEGDGAAGELLRYLGRDPAWRP